MSVLNRSIPILVAPILTRYLSPEDYGIVSIFRTSVPLVMGFITMQSTAALNRFFFESNSDDIARMTGDAFKIIAAMFFLLSVGFFLTSDTIASLLNIPSPVVRWIVFTATFMSFTDIFLNRCRVQQKAIQFGIFQIVRTVVNISLTLFLVVGFSMKWEGRLIGIISAEAIAAIAAIALLILFRQVSLSRSSSFLSPILKFSTPLIPNRISKRLVSTAERFFLASLIGLGATGLYSVSAALASIMIIVHESLGRAWTPVLFKELSLETPESRRRCFKAMVLYKLIMLGIGLSILLIMPFAIPILVDEKFYEVKRYVPWIIIAYTVGGFRGATDPFLRYAKKTTWIGSISSIMIFVHLTVAYFWILDRGALGAAQATLFSYSLEYVLTLFLFFKAGFFRISTPKV